MVYKQQVILKDVKVSDVDAKGGKIAVSKIFDA